MNAINDAQSQELLELARWISRCASMNGPIQGTTVYFIKAEIMEQLRLLVNYIDADHHASL